MDFRHTTFQEDVKGGECEFAAGAHVNGLISALE